MPISKKKYVRLFLDEKGFIKTLIFYYIIFEFSILIVFSIFYTICGKYSDLIRTNFDGIPNHIEISTSNWDQISINQLSVIHSFCT